ncbi:MAG: PTS sugar transporter subunit IIA [Planctomycetota bacterium]|nr:PTS sugar transporter subunit IIA [Planctomycetota bacterium]MDA0935354.1 PTS sugar transporter subunit IIA [Planctomycetota bacterium]
MLEGANPLLTVALVILTGVASGSLARRAGLPGVTGQILAGVLIGPSFVDLFGPSTGDSLQPMMHFALGLVAVMVGSHLALHQLRNAARRLLILVLLEATLTPALVLAAVTWAGAEAPVSWLLAAVAIATAPATVVALVKECRARGVFVKTLVAAVALNNIACILLFEVARVAARLVLDPEGGHTTTDVLLAPVRQLLLSALLGGTAGYVLTRVTRDVVSPDRLATASLITILLTAGIADHTGMSALLACMFLGIALTNITPDKDEIGHRVFADFESAIFAIFFTIAGMQLHLDALLVGGGIAIALFVARIAGKSGAALAAMHLAGATRPVRRWLGPALTPQAGVAVGLVLLIGDEPVFAPIYELLLAVGLAVVTANEIVGPILTRVALRKSGDAGKDRARLIDFLHEEHIVTNFRADSKEEAIDKLTDVLVASNALQIDREAFLQSVLERENDLSTCIGEGLAIPHGVLPSGDRMVGVLAISRDGLAFDDSPDGELIHCMVLLATPQSQRDRHLEVLAALARAVGANPQVRKQLFRARSPAHVYDLLHAEESVDFNRYLDE